MFECKACIRGNCDVHTARYAELCRENSGVTKAAVEGVDFRFNEFGHVVPLPRAADDSTL